MKVAISVVRAFHAAKMANLLRKHTDQTGIWTSAQRKAFRSLQENVETHFVPAPVEIFTGLTHFKFPPIVYQRGIQVWDRMVAASIPSSTDLVIGFATQTLGTELSTRKRGRFFALDRACPYVDFQQDLIRRESEATGAKFTPEPAWFRDRQIAEYENADAIVVPSNYSGRTFPAHLQSKLVLAPLLGRAQGSKDARIERNTPFTVGVLGGNPLRKGYRFLLEAWNRLKLPNARLQIRTSSDFSAYPKLAELMRESHNVEILEYIPNISEFYQRCDLFVLPSLDDGFGMALFEALANGVPCIATHNCGASELLVNGQDCIVIDAGSTDQLASSMAYLYENEERRQEFARAGLAAVERISSSSLYEDGLLELLRRVKSASASGQRQPAVTAV
jgi:glycosyltransferase involved in cell wall biosynthesis